MVSIKTGDNRTVTITGEHEAFDGTAFAGEDFEFTLNMLTAAQRNELLRRHARGGKAEIDFYRFGRDLFIRTVAGWSRVEFDGALAECTDDNKATLYDKANSLAQAIMEAARIEQERFEAGRAAEIKNS
jgi:hypothetical protein